MKSSNQPLVSVVTPVYNSEKYLTECIESVLAQTYKNWEYIIVNNCSTDRSPEIIKNYAEKDHRIIFHSNKEFVSAIENHHIAFRKISSKSKYCKVVHADDFLFPECLERMLGIGEKYPRVGIVSSYRLDGVRVNLDGLRYPSHVTSGREICRRSFLEDLYVFGSPTSLLIRSDIIRSRSPFYDEPNFGLRADTAACYDILINWDFGFVHQVLTYSRRHEESQSSGIQNIDSPNWVSLITLKKCAPFYLKEEEYDRLFKREIKGYYKYLAKSAFQKRGKQFWAIHEEKMKKLECPLSKIKLLQAISLEIMNVLLNQKRLVSAIIRRIKPH